MIKVRLAEQHLTSPWLPQLPPPRLHDPLGRCEVQCVSHAMAQRGAGRFEATLVEVDRPNRAGRAHTRDDDDEQLHDESQKNPQRWRRADASLRARARHGSIRACDQNADHYYFVIPNPNNPIIWTISVELIVPFR